MAMDKSKKVGKRRNRGASSMAGNSTGPGRRGGGVKVKSTKSNRKDLPKR